MKNNLRMSAGKFIFICLFFCQQLKAGVNETNVTPDSINILNEASLKNLKRLTKICKSLRVENGDEIKNELENLSVTNLDHWYALANIFRHENRLFWSYAKSIYKKIIAHKASSLRDRAFANLGLAKIYRRQGKINKSFKTIKTGLKTGSDCPDLKIWLANSTLITEDQNRIELLKTVLLDCKDTLMIAKIYISFGNIKYIDSWHDNHAKWYLEALRLLKNKNNPVLLAKAYAGLGRSKYQDEFHNPKQSMLTALRLLKNTTQDSLKAAITLELASITPVINGNQERAQWYLKAYKLAQKSNEKVLLVRCLIGLGNIKFQTKTQQRKDFYILALQNLGDDGDTDLTAEALIGLGYCHLGEMGIKYFLRAKKLLKKSHCINLKAKLNIALGNARYCTRTKSRESFYLAGLNLLGENGDNNQRAQCLIGLGNMGFTDKNHPHSFAWYLEAYEKLKNGGANYLKVKALIGLGYCGYRSEKQKPKDWFLEAKKWLDRKGCKDLRAKIYIGLGSYSEDPYEAVSFYQKAISLKPNPPILRTAQRKMFNAI